MDMKKLVAYITKHSKAHIEKLKKENQKALKEKRK